MAIDRGVTDNTLIPMALVKEFLKKQGKFSLTAALVYETEAMIMRSMTTVAREGVMTFIEKREADYKGR